MRPGWGWIACLVLSAVMSAAPASAAAAAVVSIGAGEQPSAATDAAGTLHVVWRDPASPNVPVRYCRVIVGAAGCDPVPIAYDAGWAPHLMVRSTDGALIAVFSRNDGATMALASADSGTTWTPPAPVGTGLGNVYDAELTPDGSAVDTVWYSTVGVGFQRVVLGGAVESRVVSLGVPRSVRAPRVSHVRDGRPVVAEQYQAHVLGTRVPALGADPNVQDAWGSASAWRRLRHADTSDADSGPSGTWLAATMEGGGVSDPIRMWRWSKHGFTRPQTIGAGRRRAPATLGGGNARAQHHCPRRRPGQQALRRLVAAAKPVPWPALPQLPAHRSTRPPPARDGSRGNRDGRAARSDQDRRDHRRPRLAGLEHERTADSRPPVRTTTGAPCLPDPSSSDAPQRLMRAWADRNRRYPIIGHGSLRTLMPDSRHRSGTESRRVEPARPASAVRPSPATSNRRRPISWRARARPTGRRVPRPGSSTRTAGSRVPSSECR